MLHNIVYTLQKPSESLPLDPVPDVTDASLYIVI